MGIYQHHGNSINYNIDIAYLTCINIIGICKYIYIYIYMIYPFRTLC